MGTKATTQGVTRITLHAAKRFMERTGCKSIKKANSTLQKMLARATPAFGYSRNGRIRLFTNEHFTCDGWVLVIKNNSLLTCFTADHEQCMPMEK